MARSGRKRRRHRADAAVRRGVNGGVSAVEGSGSGAVAVDGIASAGNDVTDSGGGGGGGGGGGAARTYHVLQIPNVMAHLARFITSTDDAVSLVAALAMHDRPSLSVGFFNELHATVQARSLAELRWWSALPVVRLCIHDSAVNDAYMAEHVTQGEHDAFIALIGRFSSVREYVQLIDTSAISDVMLCALPPLTRLCMFRAADDPFEQRHEMAEWPGFNRARMAALAFHGYQHLFTGGCLANSLSSLRELRCGDVEFAPELLASLTNLRVLHLDSASIDITACIDIVAPRLEVLDVGEWRHNLEPTGLAKCTNLTALSLLHIRLNNGLLWNGKMKMRTSSPYTPNGIDAFPSILRQLTRLTSLDATPFPTVVDDKCSATKGEMLSSHMSCAMRGTFREVAGQLRHVALNVLHETNGNLEALSSVETLVLTVEPVNMDNLEEVDGVLYRLRLLESEMSGDLLDSQTAMRRHVLWLLRNCTSLRRISFQHAALRFMVAQVGRCWTAVSPSSITPGLNPHWPVLEEAIALAREHDVDLSVVRLSGPFGRLNLIEPFVTGCVFETIDEQMLKASKARYLSSGLYDLCFGDPA